MNASAAPAVADGPADVFLSYARENRATAEQLANALISGGLRVWWDRDLYGGDDFVAVIDAQLQAAAVVVVLWSADSAKSAFVRDECMRARDASKLLPVRIEEIKLPLGFGQLHTLDLLDWNGDTDSLAFQDLLLETQRRPGRPSDAAPLPVARHGRRGWVRRSAIAVAVAVTLGAGGYATKIVWDQRQAAQRAELDKAEADRHFGAGLDFQYAAVPRLENALNEYLSALESRPGHGRARYYLGHVYAQSGNPIDALASFKLALTAEEARLDASQRREADKQVLALAVIEGEASPITRLAASPTPQPTMAAPARARAMEPRLGLPMEPTIGARARAPMEPPTTAPVTTRSGRDTLRPGPPPADPQPRLIEPDKQISRIELPQPPPRTAPPEAMRIELPKQPPRTAPPEAMNTQLARSVDGLFDDNKEKRITATTSLVVDPEALSDAVPLAVDKALAALRGPGTLSVGASSGVVNTLVLLQSALPGTLVQHRRAIEELLAAAAPIGDYTRQQAAKVRELLQQAAGRKPIAYIQIANEAQRPLAEAVAVRMRSFGYDAPAIELVGERAPAATELRVQGKSDRSYARWVTKAVAELTEGQPSVSLLRNARPQRDTYEIWLGRDLCAPGGRQLAACK